MPVSALLQCTDPDIFYPDENPDVPAEELLFVGNSRKQYREAVRYAIEGDLPIGVYGTHWSMFIPPSFVRGEYIDNGTLRQHYTRCAILLNDHWASMRENGFISNRIFDAAGCGAFVLSDAARGSADLFGDDLVTYRSEQEFGERVEYYLAHPEERRAVANRLKERVLAKHTFAHRAVEIAARVRELDAQKRSRASLLTERVEVTLA